MLSVSQILSKHSKKGEKSCKPRPSLYISFLKQNGMYVHVLHKVAIINEQTKSM